MISYLLLAIEQCKRPASVSLKNVFFFTFYRALFIIVSVIVGPPPPRTIVVSLSSRKRAQQSVIGGPTAEPARSCRGTFCARGGARPRPRASPHARRSARWRCTTYDAAMTIRLRDQTRRRYVSLSLFSVRQWPSARVLLTEILDTRFYSRPGTVRQLSPSNRISRFSYT